jgi:hypothetical protein
VVAVTNLIKVKPRVSPGELKKSSQVVADKPIVL